MDPVPDFNPGGDVKRRHLVNTAIVIAVLVVLWFAYRELTTPVTIKVKNDQPVIAIQPDLPPPPPPPPPPPQPAEKPPEPTDQQQSPQPKAPPDAPPQQVQMDAAPSAGAAGIAAGGGGGMGAPGSCLVGPCGNGGGGGAPINEGFYLRTLSSELQAYIDRDRKLSRMVFDARLHITVSPSGAVTALEMVSPSGKAEIDEQLTTLLRGVRGLSAPPSGIRFPLNVKIRGRKAFS